MTNFKHMKKIIILLLLGNIFFLSCHNNKQYNAEIEDLTTTLDILINQQYNWLKQIDSYQNRDKYADSIYIIGNQLIDNVDINSSIFWRKYKLFNKQYGRSQFDINQEQELSCNYIKNKIKLIQYDALSQEKMNFYESHYQVDAMGFVILNNHIRKGKKERIYIVPRYDNFQLENPPIFMINNDTLQYDNFNEQYYYDILVNEKDTLSLKAKITIWKWDRYTTINASAPLYVK